MNSGIVKSASECRPIVGVQVTALDSNRQVLSHATTDGSGKWTFEGISGIASLQFHKAGYGTKVVSQHDLGPRVRLLEERVIGYQNKLWFYPGESAQVFV